MSIEADHVTAEEAAQILRRSVATVYRLARRGRLRRMRFFGRVLLVREDVEVLAREINQFSAGTAGGDVDAHERQ